MKPFTVSGDNDCVVLLVAAMLPYSLIWINRSQGTAIIVSCNRADLKKNFFIFGTREGLPKCKNGQPEGMEMMCVV